MKTFCTANQPMIHQTLGMLKPGWNDVHDATALAAAYVAQDAAGTARYLYEAPPTDATTATSTPEPTEPEPRAASSSRRRRASADSEPASVTDEAKPDEAKPEGE